MSWFGNLKKGYRDELFENDLKGFYDSVRISRMQSLQIEPDYDETKDYDVDYLGSGLIPTIELDNETRQPTDVSKRKGRITGVKKLRIPITQKTRVYIYERAEYRCEHCDNDICEQIHHKDGNPANNEYSNLMAVCYRCHKTLDQYVRKGLNG